MTLCLAQTTQPPPQKAEPVRTKITVVGKIATETPSNVSVLDSLRLKEVPGVNLDDRLRQVPGFSLFRRSSSVAANPTTQGISLRGIGSTGASRTLVLWDGVPLNDPFGGWVYFTRVAPDDVDRVEVSRSAATSIFGDRAMSGVVSLFSRTPQGAHGSLGLEGGNLGQYSVDGAASALWGNWGLSGRARAFTTDGYYIVPANIRGRIDTPAGVRFVAPQAKVDYLGGGVRASFRADVLVEERQNGTVAQTNSTSLGSVSGNISKELGRNTLSALAFHQQQEFRAGFSALAADRNSERLTLRQSVPAKGSGGAAFWRHSSSAWNVISGGDVVRASGTSIDSLVPVGKRIGGGTQWQGGYFGQTDFAFRAVRIFLGGRHHLTDTNAGQFFNPSAGVVVGRRQWRARASAYRGFRIPTLNELHREFRAGNAVTQANPDLKAETAVGVEAGADYLGEKTKLSLTAYRDSLSGLVTNVTLVSTPAQIIRQRRNAGAAISRGVEAEVRRQTGPWLLQASYLFVDSRYSTRERIPQVPKHQGSGQVSWSRNATILSASFRATGLQFEDDRNSLLLPGFMSAQLALRHRIAYGVSATAAFENLFDREYLTGFTPAPQIGQPRLWRLGLRWDY